jgi:hypothetical protein
MVFWVFLFQQLLTTILRYASIYKKNGSCLCSFYVSPAPSLFSVEFLCSKEREKERNVWIFICFGCAFEHKRNFEMTFRSNWIHFDCQLPFNRWSLSDTKSWREKIKSKSTARCFILSFIAFWCEFLFVFYRYFLFLLPFNEYITKNQVSTNVWADELRFKVKSWALSLLLRSIKTQILRLLNT